MRSGITKSSVVDVRGSGQAHRRSTKPACASQVPPSPPEKSDVRVQSCAAKWMIQANTLFAVGGCYDEALFLALVS
jgi:hypothetical protein